RAVTAPAPAWPRRCSYCDFAIAVRRTTPVAEYLEALERELDLRFPRSGRWEADTLYFGGGTPSRLGGPGVAELMDVVQRWGALVARAGGPLGGQPPPPPPREGRISRRAGGTPPSHRAPHTAEG